VVLVLSETARKRYEARELAITVQFNVPVLEAHTIKGEDYAKAISSAMVAALQELQTQMGRKGIAAEDDTYVIISSVQGYQFRLAMKQVEQMDLSELTP
jgi:cobalamin biosynthesis protein CobT